PATIVMPSDAPAIKIEGTKKYAATIHFYNRKTDSREAISAEIAKQSGAVIVPAFDDLDVMAGQGTVGLEIVEQLQALGETPDAVLVPVGGGGLMAGVSTAVKTLVPAAEMTGVEPDAFDDHRKSALSGQRESVDIRGDMFCDALLAAAPGELTWAVNQHTVSQFVTVTDNEVRDAMRFAFRYLKLVVEPGGVVALAALLQKRIEVQDRTVCIILSGGNVDPVTFSQSLQER
ncbi:MAG: pyridoxal-phosphate dependent enzyme, partial [Pseudohongiellaceae bacterium]